MALAHIGADANISAISPPDGSVEAGYCAQFYGQARVEMLEPGAWHFAIKRVALAEVTNVSETWEFAYGLPSDCLSAKRVLSATALDDDDSADFDIEAGVLYTNEEDATLVYVRDITDSTKFTPSFTSALSYLLAGYLAGPIIKGIEGTKIAQAMRQIAGDQIGLAAAASANASSKSNTYQPSIVAARA
jgi:hypothetical protein